MPLFRTHDGSYFVALSPGGDTAAKRQINTSPSPFLSLSLVAPPFSFSLLFSSSVAPNQKTSNRARRIVQPHKPPRNCNARRERRMQVGGEKGKVNGGEPMRREEERREGGEPEREGRARGGRRTSSDFSAVAAASERAALLCTSSLMASPVQPWLGSVLYHTAGRAPRYPPPHAPLTQSLSLCLSLAFRPSVASPPSLALLPARRCAHDSA